MKTSKASDLMTRKVHTIKMDDSIRVAFQVMQEYRIRHLPVRDHLGRITGILSDRDVARAAKVRREGVDAELYFDSDDLVKDFMSWPVESVISREPIVRIAERMIEEKKSCFLVAPEIGSEPQGIVTSEDLLKALVEIAKTSPDYSRMHLGDLWSETVLI